MLSSSIQATLAGRFGKSEYGLSKKAGEDLFFDYSRETGAKVAIYRFPNLMGHSRPNYNSAISTFCYAIANDEPFTVNNPSVELELLYIDDLVEGMFDLLEGKERHCEFDGVKTVDKEDGRYLAQVGQYLLFPFLHRERLDPLLAGSDAGRYAQACLGAEGTEQ